MSALNLRNCVAVAIVVAAGVAACDRKAGVTARTAQAPDASAQVIGVKPAEPSVSEPPGVTPVAPNTTYISKEVESKGKPQEGDNHSYSTTAHVTPQKSGYVDPVQAPERKKE